MEKPLTVTALKDAAGISQSYASMILSGTRRPSRALAIHIFRKTGWRHDLLDGLTDEQIAVLEEVEPYTPALTACPICERRADDPVSASCTRSDCGLRASALEAA